MRLHVVSDVHGAVDALRRAGDGADALVCLGDLILFVDYADHSQGIFADLFGAANASELVRLRTAGRFAQAREFSTKLWDDLLAEEGRPRAEVVEDAVRRQYAALFEAMPTPAYLTYGNVDVPVLFREYLREGHHLLDGQTIELAGRRLGFVGAGLRTRYRTPNEIPDEEFAAKVEALGQVDVLFSHIPPALPDITYDVVARRFERGSAALLEAVRATQPRLLLHGHVHQPLVGRTRIGRTEVVNVGHFRGRGTPYVLDL